MQWWRRARSVVRHLHLRPRSCMPLPLHGTSRGVDRLRRLSIQLWAIIIQLRDGAIRNSTRQQTHHSAISHPQDEGRNASVPLRLGRFVCKSRPQWVLNPYPRQSLPRHHSNTQEHNHDILVFSLSRALSSDPIEMPITYIVRYSQFHQHVTCE